MALLRLLSGDVDDDGTVVPAMRFTDGLSTLLRRLTESRAASTARHDPDAMPWHAEVLDGMVSRRLADRVDGAGQMTSEEPINPLNGSQLPRIRDLHPGDFGGVRRVHDARHDRDPFEIAGDPAS